MSSKQSFYFISNTDIINPKGGWDGLGSMLYNILDKHFDVQLLDNINPKVSILDKYLNILKKKMGIKSNFYFFSRNRLKKIAGIYSRKLDEKTSFLFFHGSTPWAHIIPDQKYFVLLDCSFKTYLTVYHDKSKFSGFDLNRLYKHDKAFLNNAELVLFTSSFALNKASSDYNLSTEKFISISQGPSIPASERYLDSTIKKKQFLFIASNFEGKGGLLIYNAFKRFAKLNSDYKLVIVGQKPPQYILDNNNVTYLGFIDKSNVDGLSLLVKLYTESLFLLLLSDQDIAPLVIIEAANEFCPSIALNTSAVSEMIVDNETGYILNGKSEELLLLKLIETTNLTNEEYLRICLNAKDFMSINYNWASIEKKFIDVLESKINICK